MRTILLTTTILPSLLHAQTGGNLSNCKGGCQLGELCVGNPFSQPVSDDECLTCAGGKYWWPCNFETLCYCNSVEENTPRIPPAPKSGLRVNEDLDACTDILTQDVFNAIVQPTSDEARALYTYDGLCNAINQYNEHHAEKFANMGTEEQMRAEVAAFLAHTYVDTNGYSVTREDMHCVNPIIGTDGKTYCQPCKEEHYDAQTKTCSQSYFDSANSYKEYCDVTRQPPQGCACTNESVQPTTFVPGIDASIDTTGYMVASDAYFTRGSSPISWNYDYYGASQSLTGNPDLLCNNPDLVATNPQLAWGVGIYKWMEKMTFGTTGSTAHKQALKGNFGGTIEVLYGELECPASEWSSASHVDMVQERVAQICKTGSVLGVYLEMDKCGIPSDCLQCEGLREIYDSCTEDGSCEACPTWTEYVRSSAPTVTPIRVSPPTFEDWDYRPRSSSVESVSSSYWFAVSSLVCLVVISGSWS